MPLGHLTHDAGLLGRGHGLPATVIGHLFHPALARRGFRDEQIGVFRKFRDGIAGAGIPGKHNHAIRRFKTIGIGLVLAGSRAFMEIKMAVFDGRHLDVRVLINHPGADIMTEEYLGYRHAATSVGNPDLGTDSEILNSGLDQLCCPGRAIDMDRFSAILIPRHRQQRTKTSRVIVMMVSDKNNADFPDVDTSFRKTPRDAVARINDIMRPVDS